MSSNREQKLINICYEIALTINDRQDYFKCKTYGEVASWVSTTLKESGFETEPCGSSWGILKEK